MLDRIIDGESRYYELKERLEEVIQKVHICKMSYGWQVCFDHNWGKYYKPNRKELEKFLSEPDMIIEDEEGVRFTAEEFWEIVEAHNSNENNNWTAQSYRKYKESHGIPYPVRAYRYEEILKCESLFGVDCHGDTDFIVDGLRFATYSDFR